VRLQMGDGTKLPVRFQTGMRTMIALVACVALLFWAWRHVRENSDPVLSEARDIQSRAIQALLLPKASERIAAIHELERLVGADDSVSLRHLTAMVADENAEVRLAAAQGLTGIGASVIRSGRNPEDVRAMVAGLVKLLEDPQPDLRGAALTTLGAIHSPKRGAASSTPQSVIAALAAALGDREAKVRGAAVVALAEASWGWGASEPPKAFAAALKDESAENRRTTVAYLWRFRSGLDSWLPSLLDMAEHDDDPEVRQRCFGAMQWIKRPAITVASIPTLVTALGSRDRAVRSAAATLLSEFQSDASEAIPTLLSLWAKPPDQKTAEADGGPDWGIASALAKLAPESDSSAEVMKAFMDVVQSGPRVKQGPAAWALGEFGPEAAPAIPGLIRMLRETGASDKSVNGEEFAARALGLIAPETPAADEAVTVLAGVLNSKSNDSRAAALESLLKFGPRASIALPRIRELRDDRDVAVRQLASKAMAQLDAGGKP
jgi:HEAT repeat protein